MKNFMKIACITAVSGLTMVGCTISNPDSSHVGLHYTNGAMSDRNFEYCVQPGNKETGGAGDDDFYYPAGQRSFTFANRDGADMGALGVNTAGGQVELVQEGQLTFHINTDCGEYTDAQGKTWKGGHLQKLHETLGKQANAYTEDEDKDAGDGWPKFLVQYLGGVVNKAVDNEGQKDQWMDLFGKSDTRGAWEKRVKESIPGLIKSQLGDDLITVDAVQLQTPQVPDAIKQEMLNQQAAVLRNKTSELDKQNAQQFASFQEYLAYQQALAVNEAIKSGKANINISTPGAGLIVGAK